MSHLPSQVCQDRFLIIAGVSKAGTTSLFSFLAAHPEIAPCRVKEPFYFLPLAVPFPIRPRVETDGIERYLALFHGDGGRDKVRLEASSLYFSYPGVAETVSRMLPNVRIVVSMREPISRLLSAYRMASRNGWIPRGQTANEYAVGLLEESERPVTSAYRRLGLDQGRYASSLRRWHQLLGAERVLPIWFDELVSQPAIVGDRIARFAQIDPAPLAGKTLPHQNVSGVAAPRSLLVRWYRRGKGRGGPLGNTQDLDAEVRRRLTEYYASDTKELDLILGQPPPWATTAS